MNTTESSTPLLRCRTELTPEDHTFLVLAKAAKQMDMPLDESEILPFKKYVTPEVYDHVMEHYR